MKSIRYEDTVREALCFGWIDSVRYSVGDGSFAQRITPRRRRSNWSAVNIKRFQELAEGGLVSSSGRAAFDARP